MPSPSPVRQGRGGRGEEGEDPAETQAGPEEAEISGDTLLARARWFSSPRKRSGSYVGTAADWSPAPGLAGDPLDGPVGLLEQLLGAQHALAGDPRVRGGPRLRAEPTGERESRHVRLPSP